MGGKRTLISYALAMTTQLRSVTSVLLSLCSVPAFGANSPVYSSHRCGGSPVGWSRQGTEFGELLYQNRIDVSRHFIRWNGRPVTAARLSLLLSEARHLNPRPGLDVVFRGDVDCRKVQMIREDVTSRLACGPEQRCVEYSYAEWARSLPPEH